MKLKTRTRRRALPFEDKRPSERFPILLSVEEQRQLVMSVVPMAWREARKWSCCKDHLEDVVQGAMVWACIAARRFDPSRGAKFSTFVLWYIRGAIKQHVRAGHGDVLNPPSKKWETKTLSHYVRLDSEAVEDGGSMHDLIGDPEADQNGAETALARSRSTLALRAVVDSVLARLTPREQLIVRRRHMADREDVATLAEIGDELGLSRERVRQIEQKTLVKLARMLARQKGDA